MAARARVAGEIMVTSIIVNVMKRAFALASVVALLAMAQAPADLQLLRRARQIHDRVVTLDTHVDISPADFTPGRNYTQDLPTQVTLPKMIEGGLDAAFFIVFTEQGPLTPEGYDTAYTQAIEKFDAIHRLTKEIAPDKIALALTAADVPRIAATGRKVALIGVENAYPLGPDLGRIKEFYGRGMRYMSLAHNGHSQFADSNTGEREGWMHNGLSDAGRAAVAELNRLGVMVDVSHTSKASMMQTVALSKAPVIASHSSVRALVDHSRNLDDEQLLALKKNGGVVQIVAFGGYLKTQPPDSPRATALAALRKEFGLPPTGSVQTALNALPAERRAEYNKRLADIDRRLPAATLKDLVDHIDYVVKLIGIDHVGISSDFDGGGGVGGWNDASETFNVTLELVRRGYTEPQIAQLWSGNLLRVMAAVQRTANTL
jgi:membrane dipeptidase